MKRTLEKEEWLQIYKHSKHCVAENKVNWQVVSNGEFSLIMHATQMNLALECSNCKNGCIYQMYYSSYELDKGLALYYDPFIPRLPDVWVLPHIARDVWESLLCSSVLPMDVFEVIKNMIQRHKISQTGKLI